MVTRVVPSLAVLLAVLGGGCGEEQSRDENAGARPPRAAPETITEGAGGESFTLAVGSETRLRLSGKYDWSEPTARGDAVELTRVDYFQDPGYSEWGVLAVRRGTATIAARGSPACAGRERCPEEPLRFEVKLTVAP